jgi:hypothetical protein
LGIAPAALPPGVHHHVTTRVEHILNTTITDGG